MKKTAIVLMDDDTGDGDWFPWPGGMGEFRVHGGTWGGGNASLQVLGPADVAQAVDPSCTLTADGGAIFTLGAGQIRVVATTATGVSALAVPVPPQ